VPTAMLAAHSNISADPLGLLVAFGAGMLSFISPCVLPLAPGYVSTAFGMPREGTDLAARAPQKGGNGPTRVAEGPRHDIKARVILPS